MSNLAGKAYGMNAITPIPSTKSWINRLIFQFIRCFPSTLSGLVGLKFIHFARWTIIRPGDWPNLGQGAQRIKHDYMLFTSNFNGTWDQYIDAFSDGIPGGLNLFWYQNVKYPGSIPISPFKAYIRANQIDTDYYYNATPGAGQRDVISALRVREAVLRLVAGHPQLSPETFAYSYAMALLSIQNDLPTQGYAPLASIDTERAERNRQALLTGWHANP